MRDIGTPSLSSTPTIPTARAVASGSTVTTVCSISSRLRGGPYKRGVRKTNGTM